MFVILLPNRLTDHYFLQRDFRARITSELFNDRRSWRDRYGYSTSLSQIINDIN